MRRLNSVSFGFANGVDASETVIVGSIKQKLVKCYGFFAKKAVGGSK